MRARVIYSVLANASLFLALQTVHAQSLPAPDSSSRQVPADMPKEPETDRGLVKHIRRTLMADKDLSAYAHHVKIIAINGQVTLNGVVRSDDEKIKVEGLAKQIAGNPNVVDDLKVAPPKS
jgi:hyperosmotically inducible periplasmic protein